jgi:hypothetical protein
MGQEANGKRKAKKKGEEGKKGEEKAAFLFGLGEREIILFLMEFMLASALVLGAWYYIGPFYQTAVFGVARLFLLLMGYTPLQIAAVNLSSAYLGNFNLVPLVALALVTPKLTPRRRVEMLAIGLPLLFLLHVIDLVAHFPLYFHDSGVARILVYSIGVAGVALPFIIWFLLCYGPLFRGRSAVS